MLTKNSSKKIRMKQEVVVEVDYRGLNIFLCFAISDPLSLLLVDYVVMLSYVGIPQIFHKNELTFFQFLSFPTFLFKRKIF